MLPCGRWFDAVRLSGYVAERVFGRLLISGVGPVIRDQVGDVWCWLIRPGAGDGWGIAGVTVLGEGRSVAVPPGEWVKGPSTRWFVAPRGDCLTDPDRLRDAVRFVFGGGGRV